MNPTQRVADLIDDAYSNASGEELAERIGALLSEDAEATAWTGADDHWYGREEIIDGWLRAEARRFPSYRKRLGRIRVGGPNIAVFHVVSCEPAPDTVAEWLALDLFRVNGEGLIQDARFNNDTVSRAQLDRTIDANAMWAAIDETWSPVTTAANRVGMQQVRELKSVVRPTRERYDDLMRMFEPDIELWSWEADQLLHLVGVDAVNEEFIEALFPLLPDFYEAVGRCYVFGNAFVMPQNPCGTFEDASGRRTFSAWYNCDIYVFREQRVHALFFARDTLKDRSQMLAAFGELGPRVPSSLHLTGVGLQPAGEGASS
jgi:hypothetical protein